jgi:HEPN domain-containing protein
MKKHNDITNALLYRALTDYTNFYLIFDTKPALLDNAVFNAQQAVEKWLKHLLKINLINPPYTHDIGELVNLLSALYPELTNIEYQYGAFDLIEYAVEVRYSDIASPIVTEYKDLHRAKAILELFRTFVESKLGHSIIELT